MENAGVLLTLPINPPPPLDHQRELAELLQDAFRARDQAADDIQELQDRIATGQV